MGLISYQVPPANSTIEANPLGARSSRVLAALFLRTAPYLRPQLRHFALYYLLVAVLGMFQLWGFLLFYDLLLNKVFLGAPLSSLQALLLGLDPAQFADVDTLTTAARIGLRDRLAIAGCVILLGGIVLGAIAPYYLTWILQRVNQDLRTAMMARAEQLSLRFHRDAQVGDAVYRVFQDSAMVTAVVQNILIRPSVLVVSLLFNLLVAALFAPWLAVLFAAGTLPLVFLVGWFTPRLEAGSLLARGTTSALASHIQESMNNLKVIKANARITASAQKLERRSAAALRAAYRLRRDLALMTLATVFVMAAAVLLADYLMASWVLDERQTFTGASITLVGFAIWNLGAFQAARSRLTNVSASMFDLTYLYGLAQDMGMGLSRVFQLLEREPDTMERADARPLGAIEREIRLDDVDFSYDGHTKVLHGIDLRLRPGTMTALVGPTGAGKTTLINLLLRLYDPDRGSILVDDTDLRDIRIDDLRARIGLALQENVLFAGSVADNIRYAAITADDNSVARAATIACADEFIQRLPRGLATELGERGSKLSTGQRQRLSIARAVLKAPSLLILDEPTASLDGRTEARLLANLAEWAESRFLLLVTHRTSLMRAADRVLFMAEGRILESGTFDELCALPDGRFRAFVERMGRPSDTRSDPR